MMRSLSLYHATTGASIVIAALAAFFSSAASAQQPETPLGQLMQPAFTEVPVSIGTFQNLTSDGRTAYLTITVEALKWSGEFSGCTNLTPEALGPEIDKDIGLQSADTTAKSPLMEPLVMAAATLCQ